MHPVDVEKLQKHNLLQLKIVPFLINFVAGMQGPAAKPNLQNDNGAMEQFAWGVVMTWQMAI